jgi:hypothetical protein
MNSIKTICKQTVNKTKRTRIYRVRPRRACGLFWSREKCLLYCLPFRRYAWLIRIFSRVPATQEKEENRKITLPSFRKGSPPWFLTACDYRLL